MPTHISTRILTHKKTYIHTSMHMQAYIRTYKLKTQTHVYLHTNMHTFIHSGYFYSASSSPLLLRGTPDTPQATVNEGLAQGPYVAARVRFEPMTLRTKGHGFDTYIHICKQGLKTRRLSLPRY